jgi:hypothetical protein
MPIAVRTSKSVFEANPNILASGSLCSSKHPSCSGDVEQQNNYARSQFSEKWSIRIQSAAFEDARVLARWVKHGSVL